MKLSAVQGVQGGEQAVAKLEQQQAMQTANKPKPQPTALQSNVRSGENSKMSSAFFDELHKVALLNFGVPGAIGGAMGAYYAPKGKKWEGAKRGAYGATVGAHKGALYEGAIGAAGGAAGGALFGGVGAAPGAAIGGFGGLLSGGIGGGVKGFKQQMAKMREDAATKGSPMPNQPPAAPSGARMAAATR